MSPRLLARMIVPLVALVLGTNAFGQSFPTAFTYQGSLQFQGAPAQGSFDLRFTPYNASIDGAPLAAGVVVENAVVSGGVFSVAVDFGAGFFVGDAVYLEIAVREGASIGGFQSLLPRQVVTPTPYALKVRAGSVTDLELAAGSVGISQLGAAAVGTPALADGAVTTAKLASNAVTGANIAVNAVSAAQLADNAVDTAAIGDLQVTTPKLANAAVTSAKIAAGAVGASQIDGNQVQLRNDAVCPTGLPLIGLRSDGRPICDAAHPVLDATVPGQTSGHYPSLALRPDGRAVVSHQYGLFYLGFHDCFEPACGNGLNLSPIGTTTVVGPHSAVALRGSTPMIAYKAITGNQLSLFACSKADCTAGAVRTLDNIGVGEGLAIAVRSDNRVLLSYQLSSGQVRLYDCANFSCSSGTGRDIALASLDLGATSVVVRANGLPLVTWFDATPGLLKLFDCSTADCSAGTVRSLVGGTLAQSAGQYHDLVLRTDGRPLITFTRGNAGGGFGGLDIYDCNDAGCSSGVSRVLVSQSGAGRPHRMAIRADGLPIISYLSSGLRLLDCLDASCATSLSRTLPLITTGDGPEHDLAVRADGRPVIAYYQNSENRQVLRLFVCGNPGCEP